MKNKKKNKKTIGIIILIILLITTGIAYLLKPGLYDVDDIREKLGPEFAKNYQYNPEFKAFKKSSRFITLSDSTQMAVDIFLPTEGPEETRFPVILEYTPYGRALAHEMFPWWQQLLFWWFTDRWEPIFDSSLNNNTRIMLSQGYAWVSADMRGTGASSGAYAQLMPKLGKDGKELIDWITAQSWSNGKVGMSGGSYLGWSQLVTAAHKPEGLKCITPQVILFDAYSEAAYKGGIRMDAWLGEYSHLLRSLNMARFEPNQSRYVAPLLPAAPVVDEDNDGQLIDEIPTRKQGDTSLFVDDLPPVYADGSGREKHYYYRYIKEHLSNIHSFRYMVEEMRFADSQTLFQGEPIYYNDNNTGSMLKAITDQKLPVLNIGGWFDGFLKGTTKIHATLAGEGSSRLLIGPVFHNPAGLVESYQELFNYKGDFQSERFAEQIRFFNRYLKDMDNGIDKEPPVKVYVMNKGWRQADIWPLQKQKYTSFYLQPDHELTRSEPAAGRDSYKVDFTHTSTYGEKKTNRWLMMIVMDTLMLRTEHDKKTLVFQTSPLEKEVEMVGHPIIHLWLSSNQIAGDVFVYLSDVDTDGRVHYVSEGQLRAGFKDLKDPDWQTKHQMTVKPDLPWHGFKKADYVKQVFAGGRVVELRFDLMPSAWLFKKGHRIRIAIAGADYGNFEYNPELCKGDLPDSCPETTMIVHQGDATPSRIEIPIIEH